MTARKWHIVVFEDSDLDFRLLEGGLARTFPHDEFAITRFAYGEDGLKALSQPAAEIPDAIFIDLGLPRMSGAQVLENILAEQQFAGKPIFLLSGLPDAYEVQETAKRGARGVISKDYDAEAFAGWAEWLKQEEK